MSIRFDDAFRWSRRWFLICATLFGPCLVISQMALDPSLVWYTSVTGLAQLLLLIMPLLAVLSLGTWGLRRLLPSNQTVSKLFRWTSWSTLGSISLFALCALVAQLSTLHSYDLYLAVTLIAQVLLYLALPLTTILLLSGIALVLRWGRKKRAGMIDHPMTRIMQRLNPNERDYLLQQLDQRYVGLGTDGELVSLDDVLEEQDDNEASEGR